MLAQHAPLARLTSIGELGTELLQHAAYLTPINTPPFLFVVDYFVFFSGPGLLKCVKVSFL